MQSGQEDGVISMAATSTAAFAGDDAICFSEKCWTQSARVGWEAFSSPCLRTLRVLTTVAAVAALTLVPVLDIWHLCPSLARRLEKGVFGMRRIEWICEPD